ncbi:MAG: ATP-binding protein [Magnetospiraceae bacterium]
MGFLCRFRKFANWLRISAFIPLCAMLGLGALPGAAPAAEPLVFLGGNAMVPYVYEVDRKAMGLAVDIGKAIGVELGRPVEFRLSSWREAQERLLRGEGDAIINMTVTDARRENYDFSATTIHGVWSLFVRAGGYPSQTIIDKPELRIGVFQEKDFTYRLGKRHFPTAQLVIQPTTAAGMKALNAGSIDLFISERRLGLTVLRDAGISNIETIAAPLGRTEQAIAIRKGDAALLAQIDGALAAIKQNGTFDSIINEWDKRTILLVEKSQLQRIVIFISAILLGLSLIIALWVVQRQRIANEQLKTAIARHERTQLELTAAIEKTAAANQAKTIFLANMSHELRTPLNAIIGFSEVISGAHMGAVSDRYREYGELITQSGHHLLEVIADILDMSKIESGDMLITPEPFDLEGLVRETVTLATAHNYEPGIIIDNKVRGIALQADRLRLKQVMLNLLSNAMKFGQDRPIRVSIDATPTMACVTVMDEGIGLSAEDINIALQPFGQAMTNAFYRQYQGVGLGLPLSKRLMELQGGSLTITSQPGRGTAVSIALPKTSPP